MDSYVLKDGTAVEIRPIRPDDGQRLRESHDRLSPESRYRRFLGVKPQLSAADARYLVDVDGSDHLALVATVHDGAEEAIVAVARYIRLADQPRTAEFAIVVGDEFQRQGLATELVDRLAQAALERGVNRFRAIMLADNVAIHRVLEHVAAAPLDVRHEGSISEVEIELAPRGIRGGRVRNDSPRWRRWSAAALLR
jgi:RimJ/RimL family protein N-acetyltransferase